MSSIDWDRQVELSHLIAYCSWCETYKCVCEEE